MLVVLVAASVVDLGELAAAWNVRHSREAGGSGEKLDLCYLRSLGSSALVPLTKLAGRTPRSEFGDRVRWPRNEALNKAEIDQSGRGWTFRNARRLAAAWRTPNLAPLPTTPGFTRTCSGRLVAVEPHAATRPPALTIGPQ